MAVATTVVRKPATSGGLKAIIERKLEGPVFLITALMMVIRAAQVYSGGALVMSRVLGPFFPAFESVTGFGLGAGGELLMTIAGRTWRGWRKEALEIETRPGLNAKQRKALIKAANEQAGHSKAFMIVGACVSLYTGISYLWENSSHGSGFSWGAALSDVAPTIIITAVVFYLGVLRDMKDESAQEAALAALDGGMTDALLAAVERFKAGISTDKDNRFIAENLPPHQAAKFRRAVAKATQGEQWTAAKVREAAGLGNDPATIRALTRQIAALAREPENGIEKAPDGRTWLIPRAIVMDTWGELIAERNIRARDAARQPIGQSDAAPPALPVPEPVAVQTDSGAFPAVNLSTHGAETPVTALAS
jgi:hypothetical protein